MRLAEYNDLIQALVAKSADQTFGNAILPRRSRCYRPVTVPIALTRATKICP
jgi:hypothetical protein